MTGRPVRLGRDDAVSVALLALLAGGVRTAYVLALDLAPYDPWRHLQLVRNLRQGLGFTLFEGQPYLWYNPGWHQLAAWLPPSIGPEWLAATLSALSIVPFYLWLRIGPASASRFAATAAGLLFAGSGPLVRFTCHVGPEALGLFLLLCGLACAWAGPSTVTAFAGGLLGGAGLTARLNLLFDGLLFPGNLRERRRALAVAAGAALPLVLVWWRNRRIIAAHSFLFTWDGLATRCADFNPLSTLVVQLHPAVQEGLRRLHAQVVPWPEWIRDASGVRWDLIALIVIGIAAVAASRAPRLILAATATLLYLLLLDASGSSHFFRVYLGLFPVLYAGIALAAERVQQRGGARATAAAAALISAAMLAGASQLAPPSAPPLDYLAPPPALLTEDAYLVNSGFYAPESWIFRYPDKRFVGLPIDPAQLPEFRRAFPGFRHVLWQDFSVQPEIERALASAGGAVREARNDGGRLYRVYAPAAD